MRVFVRIAITLASLLLLGLSVLLVPPHWQICRIAPPLPSAAELLKLMWGADDGRFDSDVAELLGDDLRQLRGVGFTHLHIDHSQGVVPFCAARGDVSNTKAALLADVGKPFYDSHLAVPESTARMALLRRWLAALDVRADTTVIVSHDLRDVEASGLPESSLSASRRRPPSR